MRSTTSNSVHLKMTCRFLLVAVTVTLPLNTVAGCGSSYGTLFFNTSRLMWNTPENFTGNVLCRWLVVGDIGARVRLEIKVNGITRQRENTCDGNYISVYDGWNENDPTLHKDVCHNLTLESSGRQMFVRFITDDTNTGPEFTMYYQGFSDKLTTGAPPRTTTSECITSTTTSTSTTDYKTVTTHTGKNSGSPAIAIMGVLTALGIFGAIVIGFILHFKCFKNTNSSTDNSSRRRNNITNYCPSARERRNNSNRNSNNQIDRSIETTRSITDNRYTPSAPPDSDSHLLDPPSYSDIVTSDRQLASQPSPSFPLPTAPPPPASPQLPTAPLLPPPPSYMDAIQKGYEL